MDVEKLLGGAADGNGAPSVSKQEEYVGCGTLYSRYSKCMSPGAQLESIRRTSEGKNCAEFFNDWTTCLQAKITNDPVKVKELFEATTYYQQKKAHVNDIFEYKAKPSWE